MKKAIISSVFLFGFFVGGLYNVSFISLHAEENLEDRSTPEETTESFVEPEYVIREWIYEANTPYYKNDLVSDGNATKIVLQDFTTNGDANWFNADSLFENYAAANNSTFEKKPRIEYCGYSNVLYKSNQRFEFRNPEFGSVRRKAQSYSFGSKGSASVSMGYGPVSVSYSRGGGSSWSIGADPSKYSVVNMIEIGDVYRKTFSNCTQTQHTVVKSEAARVIY
jgi:hypothetical protein